MISTMQGFWVLCTSDDKLVKYLEPYNPGLLEAFTTLELSERLEFLDDNMNKYI